MPSERDLLGTVESLFERLKQEGKITPNNIKDHQLTLCVYVCEVEDWEEDDDGLTSSYTSSFRPCRNPAVESPIQVELAYDEYEFERTTFTTDTYGNLLEHVSLDTETIKIARDWRRHVSDKPASGYISKGFMKFAFAGQTGGKMYAIFQCKLEQVVEAQNSIDLIAELCLLALGQYFANSFEPRVRAMGAAVEPSKLLNQLWAGLIVLATRHSWNFEGAFMGKVTSGMLPHPADGEEDNRSLIYPIFLVAPLIATTGLYKERKFSGNDQAGNNNDEVGRVIDAYSHHVLVDSNGFLLLSDLQGVVGPDKEVILFDPQAHSFTCETGFWDGGRICMEEWQKQHTCQALCRKLGLKDAVVTLGECELTPPLVERPLRFGFPSPKKEVHD
ncbi:uncharacterized protein LACBIDRAFT_303845 [Laccaria bicolor S238N-H82]|uniref:Predicted protein n=1 Tax=Laccaria bicolor (strain S238N-H82 / ATCC MYA-4686) TaxID=486041 RepID=B0DKG9_LACBS|nr:uncharacterized protein LACBIDRAFT_303845 [Laccaria bicolor S238N-H82]EDR04945.1 predicted protein [Laccaria bicolor S238N-H82]|eukprot:XP_001884335.1 predicted protein [Laccaria bicolor S238N-H82]